jgi:hypothetical protein
MTNIGAGGMTRANRPAPLAPMKPHAQGIYLSENR